MFKKIAQKGFTLVEIMVALGIMSAVVLVITSVQNQSIKSTKDAKRTQAVNELIQFLTSELTKLETCKANFKNSTNYTVATPIGTLVNATGKTLLSTSASYQEDLIKVTAITAQRTGSRLTVTVQYQTQKATESTTPPPGTFSIVLNVFADSTTNQIYSCFSDQETAITNAVVAACAGAGATYIAPAGANIYGTCIHQIKLKDSNNVDVAAVNASPTYSYTCPAGEMLGSVEVAAGGYRILKCKKFGLNSGTLCGAWEYMSGTDASGNAVCSKILDLVGPGNTGFIAHNGASFIAFSSLTACTGGKVLNKITVSGTTVTPGCVDPYLSNNCPVAGQYAVSTNADGSLNCQNYPNNNACSGGQLNYAIAVNNVGVVTCGPPTLTGSCTAAGQAVIGTNAIGGVVCGSLPP